MAHGKVTRREIVWVQVAEWLESTCSNSRKILGRCSRMGTHAFACPGDERTLHERVRECLRDRREQLAQVKAEISLAREDARYDQRSANRAALEDARFRLNLGAA